MPIPSYPENRREEYLNNIATGSGEIPPYPENREEQYLDAIAKGGGGGGSGGGVLVLHMDYDTGALDKTWQEIYDGLLDGIVFVLPSNEGTEEEPACMLYVVNTAYLSADYIVDATALGSRLTFYASTANDYPVAGS